MTVAQLKMAHLLVRRTTFGITPGQFEEVVLQVFTDEGVAHDMAAQAAAVGNGTGKNGLKCQYYMYSVPMDCDTIGIWGPPANEEWTYHYITPKKGG